MPRIEGHGGPQGATADPILFFFSSQLRSAKACGLPHRGAPLNRQQKNHRDNLESLQIFVLPSARNRSVKDVRREEVKDRKGDEAERVCALVVVCACC